MAQIFNLKKTIFVLLISFLVFSSAVAEKKEKVDEFKEPKSISVLNKRIDSLTDKINDLGYEIINLEGQPFNEGMTVDANFMPDENLDEGVEVISRVIKPQVNYKGKLIQPAQVEVAQGVN